MSNAIVNLHYLNVKLGVLILFDIIEVGHSAIVVVRTKGSKQLIPVQFISYDVNEALQEDHGWT